MIRIMPIPSHRPEAHHATADCCLQGKDKIINIAEAIGDQWRVVGIASAER